MTPCRGVRATGIDIQPATARPIAPRRNRQQPATAQAQPLTLAELADAKRLDAEKLRAWHAHEIPAGHAPEAPNGGIAIPYRTREGELHAVQYRLTEEKVNGVDRFKWRKGDTPILYGLWRLCEWTGSDTLYLCEGTSDTWTLWHADLPALGIPSATTWCEEWWREVEGFERIVLIPDNDEAGAKLVRETRRNLPRPPTRARACASAARRHKRRERALAAGGRDPERFKEALEGCEIILDQLLKECQNIAENRRPAPACASQRAALQRRRTRTGVCSAAGRRRANRARHADSAWRTPQSRQDHLLIHACRAWVQQNLRVVYLSEDSRAVWRERVKRFPELNALILNAIPRAHPENWARAIRELEPDIVIVDTIRRFMPPKTRTTRRRFRLR
jgi:hypothetical protein